MIDGWEMNGEIFPSEGDHPLLMKDRVNEFCGRNRWFRKTFVSSQNAAILQYRVPLRGKGFVVSAKYPKSRRREYKADEMNVREVFPELSQAGTLHRERQV